MLINCLSAAAETAGWHNWGTQHRGENRPDGGRGCIRRDRHRRLATGTGSSPAAGSNNPGGNPDGHPSVDPPVQPPVGSAATVAEDPWTEELARARWVLLSPNVQQIYRRVAYGDDHALARDFLLHAMSLTVRALSGRLSSQGHALRRIRRRYDVNLPHPRSFDQPTEQYRMRPNLADAIVELNL